MAVSPLAALAVRYSGGSTNPSAAASLGGAMSTERVRTSLLTVESPTITGVSLLEYTGTETAGEMTYDPGTQALSITLGADSQSVTLTETGLYDVTFGLE